MKKVIVIGCPGSGKSTFSRSLAAAIKLPLYPLDMLYWNADRTTVPKTVFLKKLDDILKQEAWIIDGNYGSTMDLRLNACDTVFFLDYPTEICLAGIMERRGKSRPDIPWVEKEIDAEFLTFVQNFALESRPAILALLQKYPDKRKIIFHTRKEADDFLRSLFYTV